jgi:enamine deaminase RidA (YjgF/YER057c/UK114 family)
MAQPIDLAGRRANALRKRVSPTLQSRISSIKGEHVDPRVSVLDLPQVTRMAVMITSSGQGSFHSQAKELLETLGTVLHRLSPPATVTIQHVFLRDAQELRECEQLFAQHYGMGMPVTNLVVQPPCNGAALAVEAWAISGRDVRLKRYGQHAIAVNYDGLRWIYCGGIEPFAAASAYLDAMESFRRMSDLLARADVSFNHVVRTWLYVGGINDVEGSATRYQELNRARTDFYEPLLFGKFFSKRNGGRNAFPASTGIGMSGPAIVTSCMALQTDRKDVRLLALENPQQTAAYVYDARYSLQSPKFSRAMALATDKYVTTWISGTASILNSETRHVGDIERQTEQTIDNIERLICPENFRAHGISNAGATLSDLTKMRVYLKHPGDLPKCQAICERRFGAVPAIYVTADVCRPDLLVEIEGVAFSPRTT